MPDPTAFARSRWLVAPAMLAFVLYASAVSAIVRQPDGTMVPVGGSLQGYLDARGEGINATNDAAVEPQRFLPGCSIRFTVLVRDTGYTNSFGWYNVAAGRAPTAGELHELVSTTAAMGFTATLDLRTEAAYTGGEIGFYLRTPPGYVYYTERDYQPDRAVSGGFNHVLIYDSRVTRNAFYFGWEDLFNGGDNDFQDLLMIVDNLVCAGGGMPCSTGERGICAAGIRQCRSGMLTCVRTVGPSPERCDGFDNDCNGMTDDGMLCPTNQVCDRGNCVPRCVEGGCFESTVCTTRGTCVETACATVTCPDGQRCRAGMCVGLCDGVRCPAGQSCRGGRCADACAGVMCDADQVCNDGVCVARCPCFRCGTGTVCRASDGRCVMTGCETLSCPTGSVCVAGACRDACDGAMCPSGQGCTMGECRDLPPMSDAGAADAALADVGSGGADGGAFDAGRRDSGITNRDARRSDVTADNGLGNGGGACNCHVVIAPRAGNMKWLMTASIVAIALGRRRRRRGFTPATRLTPRS